MAGTFTLTLGTRDVERFLGGFHDIADEHQSAFAGRIKHVARQGFPAGISRGPGVPAAYDADQLFQMLTATALWQLGAMPARATTLLTKAWPNLRRDVLAIWLAVESSQLNGKGVEEYLSPIFWRVPVEALRHMARPDRAFSTDDDDTIEAMTTEQAQADLSRRGFQQRGSAFIKADQLVQDAIRLLGDTVLDRPGAVALFMQGLSPSSKVSGDGS